MADYDLKSITPKASVAADTEFLFGAADQSSGTPIPYAFSIIKTWIKSWIVKGDVGLGNVDNTSDATKNAASVTLTNKTLTAPVISTISNTGTITLPTSTDTLVGKATTDTLTNKTLTSPVINSPSGLKIVHPGYKAGNWYQGSGCWGATGSGNALLLNVIYLTPFFIPQKVTLSDLAADLVTAVGSSNCQLAIYNSNPSDPTRPGTLIGATASITTAANGIKNATFSGAATFQLDIGWYFFAVNSDTSNLVFSTLAVTSLSAGQLVGSATLANIMSSATNSNSYQLSAAQTYGTWPDLTSGSFTEARDMRGPFPTFKVTSVP